jgi:hypothetical protein
VGELGQRGDDRLGLVAEHGDGVALQVADGGFDAPDQ